MFNSYVSLPEGSHCQLYPHDIPVVSFIIPNERNQQGPSHIGLKFLDAFSLQTLETKLKQQELAGYFLVDSNEDCWLQQRKNRIK